jgi:hypothetical protein
MIIHIDGTDREATAKEAKAIEAQQTALTEANAQAETEKAQAKQAILDKLGLTADEIATLLS